MASAKNQGSHTAKYGVFGNRLTQVMELVGLSNARLARECNVDPSHISRFKGGLRSPKSNEKLTEAICRACFACVKEQNLTDSLCDMMGKNDMSSADMDALYEDFKYWLCDFTTSDQATALDLFYSIDNYYPEEFAVATPSEELLNALIAGRKDCYEGMEGLQQASLCFLADVYQSDAKQILLYSDFPTDWMVKGEEFIAKWAALMTACIKRGVCVSIIHNIDRDVPEMLEGLKSWLPLYMSGAIDPYYSIKSGGERFYHTLFICPGVCTVVGWQAADDRTFGPFFYHKGDAMVNRCCDMYETLHKSSHRLLRILMDEPRIEEGDQIRQLEAFPNIRIIRKKDQIIVQRLIEPQVSFVLYHPLIQDAFTKLLGAF
ncbi:MAG: helix-turn-helix domain-containing protein [Lachnospiraceae bacterium]|nr:helix-turn-helix domain-containing protein [Lachnospiraceae bacterium]